MTTAPQQAGPGDDSVASPPVVPEAAGPASPRLRLEQVATRTGPHFAEAEITLTLADRHFTASARGEGHDLDGWRLAAAAAVSAVQEYLRECSPAHPIPRIQLLETALDATSLTQEVVHAIVRLTHGDREFVLLGSALVRNDRHRAVAAAALDAVDRQLGMLSVPRRHTSTAPRQEAVVPDPPPRAQQLPPLAEPALSVLRVEEDRPSTTPTSSGLALALHLAPSACHAAVVDEGGRVVSEARRRLDPSHYRRGQPAPPEALVSLAVASCREALLRLAGEPTALVAVGLVLPGNGNAGLTPSPEGAESSETDLISALSRELDLEVHPIGETAAVAVAEARLGAAQGLDSLLFLDIGAELKAVVVRESVVLDLHQPGHVVVDARGPRCACGQMGCWQTLAGCEALVGRAIKAVTNGTPSALAATLSRGCSAVTPALVCRLAISGDAVARDAVEKTGRYLALGVVNLMSLFDPQAVMISAAPDAVRAALRHATELALKSNPRSDTFARCVLLAPELGPSAPLLGAAAWAALHHRAGGENASGREHRG